MSERSDYKPGEFCWVDLGATDIDAAAKFYGELLDWEHEALPAAEEMGGYGFFTHDGKQVAGIGSTMDGAPAAWSSYVSVANADETIEKVKEAGGNVVLPPIDLPEESGRMAVCQDPAGAFFSIMQQKEHKGAELVNEPGSWTWNQLATRDLDGAKDFYGKVFDWELTQAEEAAAAGVPFYMWQVEKQKWEEGLAGAMVIGSEMPLDAPPNWQVYFAVEDAEATIEKTNERGGSLFFGPETIPVGKLAVLADPQGAAFGIIEPDYPEPR